MSNTMQLKYRKFKALTATVLLPVFPFTDVKFYLDRVCDVYDSFGTWSLVSVKAKVGL